MNRFSLYSADAAPAIAEAFGQHCAKCAFSCPMTSAHFPAPSPTKSTGPSSRYCPKLSSVTTSGAVSVICFPSGVKTAVYTSIRLASIIGTMYLHPSGSMSSMTACPARISNVPTASSGIPAPKHSPLAVDTPTLSPVYDPGPMLTQTAEQSFAPQLLSSSISFTKTAVSEACDLGSELSLYDTISPSSASAVEHSAVAVSINIILSISIHLINSRISVLSGKGRRSLPDSAADHTAGNCPVPSGSPGGTVRSGS